MNTAKKKILKRIRHKPKGWVFTAKDFWDYGPPASIRQALKSICDSGRIRRIARGLYHIPKKHPELGILEPTPEDIIAAIKTKQHTKTQPTGAYAANLLGLSTQIPGKVIFLTDGPDKQLTVGNRIIQLKNRSPSTMAGAGQISGLFIQALRYIGKQRFTEQHMETLRKRLTPEQQREIKRDVRLAPEWIASIIYKLVSENG